MTESTQLPADFKLSRIELLHPVVISILRQMTPAEKFRLASRMHTQAREMLTHLLRSQHPEWDEEQLQKGVCRRLLGKDSIPA
ncbi:hypothetical protein [Planctomicrobium piriforme]|uniref:Uncharacterized protein n=1 Tax=Planctomicrobium piriforme TaxID=1576369 RepID=A0A1I3N679_9PLAN|nr:hypothetical protein [Planctomicrobium piriforme]SFJ04771.1 hypothetical protein SAMN05421753_1155 [Planctomicrobium piriforme]